MQVILQTFNLHPVWSNKCYPGNAIMLWEKFSDYYQYSIKILESKVFLQNKKSN